jgi:HD-GYP domain-containing protein (c-di-GMP phosphodiesterase class II)
MTTHRSYRPGMTHEQAIHELMRCAGTQFDPRVVEVFVKLPREVFSGLADMPDQGSRAQELEAASYAGTSRSSLEARDSAVTM